MRHGDIATRDDIAAAADRLRRFDPEFARVVRMLDAEVKRRDDRAERRRRQRLAAAARLLEEEASRAG